MIGLISASYGLKGHSRDYVDRLSAGLEGLGVSNIPIVLVDKKEGGPRGYAKYFSSAYGLNYNPKSRFTRVSKTVHRFFSGVGFYLWMFARRDLRRLNSFYLMDYEYLSSLFFVFCSTMLRKKLIVLIHSASLNGPLYYRLYKVLYFSLIKRCKNVSFVVNGELTKRELCSSFGIADERVDVIQYPSMPILKDVDISNVAKNEVKERMFGRSDLVVFSLIGMIRRDKNYDRALDAYSRSGAGVNANVVLLIAGSLSDVTSSQLKDWMDGLEIKNCHLQLKYLDEEELHDAFMVSDYLLVPYGVAGSSQSGPLATARAYALPALVLGGGEIGQYVEREGVGYVCESFDELSDQIANVLNDGVNLKMNLALIDSQNKYSWEVASLKYKKIFTRGLNE